MKEKKRRKNIINYDYIVCNIMLKKILLIHILTDFIQERRIEFNMQKI